MKRHEMATQPTDTAAISGAAPAAGLNAMPTDNRGLAREITTLAGHINAANYHLLRLIARFDVQEGWNEGGVRSCTHWLAWKCGYTESVAREKVRTARALENLPKISAAFARGELSYSMVRALTRKAGPDTEDLYLMYARHSTVSQVEHLVRGHENAERLQSKEAASLQHEARGLSYMLDGDGCWTFKAKLPPEAGELLIKTLDAVISQDEDERAGGPAGPEYIGGTYRIPPDSNGKPRKTCNQKRADALTAMAEHYLATQEAQDGAVALKGHERCQVMLHVDVDTLRQHSGHSGHNGRNAHGERDEHGDERKNCRLDQSNTWLHPDTARRLSCDASLVTVLKDSKGKVLNIGRRARIVPPKIRRALEVRDEGCCRFPGCSSKQYLDAHHIHHWAEGGETSLDNMVTLCRYHHRALHQGQFSVDANLTFRDSRGRQIAAGLRPAWLRRGNRYDDPRHGNLSIRHYGENVSAETCITRWNGEQPDYSLAVYHLLNQQRKATNGQAEHHPPTQLSKEWDEY